MENSKAREIIINTIQSALIGNIKETSNISPQFIADSIITNVQFGKLSTELQNEKLINIIINSIDKFKNEMNNEFNNLDSDNEKLLRNFIIGKITAYNEIIEIINNLK